MKFKCLRCNKEWKPRWIKRGNLRPIRCKFCGSLRWYLPPKPSKNDLLEYLIRFETYKS